jgi:hypothetical protein
MPIEQPRMPADSRCGASTTSPKSTYWSRSAPPPPASITARSRTMRPGRARCGQVAHDAAGFVTHRAGVDAQGLGETVREADRVGQTGGQRGAGARGQAGHVAGHFNPGKRHGSAHLQGDPPGRGPASLGYPQYPCSGGP